MDIYVCGGDYAEKLCKLCENLAVSKNIKREKLLDYGFTNFNAPYYYKVWGIIESDKYPVSFAMTIKKKGMKIIFIHGKGDGVLRNAVVHELRYRYKSYTYQDASFQEYGYGATQVTIH